ncbi:hypothetical protein PI124_g18438 [Phytophthora idaei]|nr:hypothetical protein PI125_g19107 [Phytophthora idaei]KAG3136881.1 hypothetical protein PI126_g17632 [Phytophthora idaei]KAG3236565.1 hypothetical protein PI124_g18438 [Phytophthora idaei]
MAGSSASCGYLSAEVRRCRPGSISVRAAQSVIARGDAPIAVRLRAATLMVVVGVASWRHLELENPSRQETPLS